MIAHAVRGVLFAGLLAGCSATPGTNSAYNSSGSGTAKDTVPLAAVDTIGPTAGACPWMRYCDTHTVPRTALMLVRKGELDLDGYHGEPLDLLDSMQNGSTAESRGFYTWIVTRTMIKADGYYAEGLGNMARSYAENSTPEWTAHLSDTACYAPADEREWAQFIANELLIEDENADQGLLDTCIARLNRGCRSCGASQRAWLGHFIIRLRTEHQRSLNGSN